MELFFSCPSSNIANKLRGGIFFVFVFKCCLIEFNWIFNVFREWVLFLFFELNWILWNFQHFQGVGVDRVQDGENSHSRCHRCCRKVDLISPWFICFDLISPWFSWFDFTLVYLFWFDFTLVYLIWFHLDLISPCFICFYLISPWFIWFDFTLIWFHLGLFDNLRGLDVDDVKFVINYDYPNNSEDYIHRYQKKQTIKFYTSLNKYNFICSH